MTNFLHHTIQFPCQVCCSAAFLLLSRSICQDLVVLRSHLHMRVRPWSTTLSSFASSWFNGHQQTLVSDFAFSVRKKSTSHVYFSFLFFFCFAWPLLCLANSPSGSFTTMVSRSLWNTQTPKDRRSNFDWHRGLRTFPNWLNKQWAVFRDLSHGMVLFFVLCAVMIG